MEGDIVDDTESSSSESNDETSSESDGDGADDDAQGGLGGVVGGSSSHACSASNLAAASRATTTREELTREEKHEKLQNVMDGLKALGEHGQADALRLKVKRAKEAHQQQTVQEADNALALGDDDDCPEAGDAGAVAQSQTSGTQRKSRSVSQAYASFMQNMEHKSEDFRGEAVKRAQEREERIKFESLYKKLQEKDRKIDESGSASVGAVKMEFQPHHFADMGNLRDTVLQLLRADLVPGTLLPQKVASYCSERYRLERNRRDLKNGANDLPGFCFLLRRQLLPIEIADVRAYFAAVANVIHGRIRKMGKSDRSVYVQEIMQGLIHWESKKRQEARSVVNDMSTSSAVVELETDSRQAVRSFSPLKSHDPSQTGAQRQQPALTDNSRQGPYSASKSNVAPQQGKGGCSSSSSSSRLSKGKGNKGKGNGKGAAPGQRQTTSSRAGTSVQQLQTSGSGKAKASNSKSKGKAGASAPSSSRPAEAPQVLHQSSSSAAAGPRAPSRRPLTEEDWAAMGL
ncbi:unnamed protein product [Amoebophrya sp. A25]|nr:unnamed protein product [Amoebophrya sp. A25]|eukprot:GSA25T00001165001.1